MRPVALQSLQRAATDDEPAAEGFERGGDGLPIPEDINSSVTVSAAMTKAFIVVFASLCAPVCPLGGTSG